MFRIKLFLAVSLLAAGYSSCSQNTSTNRSLPANVFTATTPCTDVTKKLLNIPLESKYEMMRWKLEINHDPKTSGPANYKLTVVYGMGKQASRDFMPGARTIEWKGKWILEKTFV